MVNVNNNRALAPGTVVHGRYRVERVLGEGGFGVTYMVHDTKMNRIAAMKEYMPLDIAYRRSGGQEVLPITSANNQGSYERFRDKFLKEAQIIYRFRGHPNIIDVQHLFCENNTAYYVMEFISGMDLGKQLQRSGERMSWDALRPIFSQVVSALREVHNSDMIHCDISPDNIFILKGGQVKLLDFGAAKSVLHGSSDSSVIMLKRGFAPPEQMSARRLGPWTDVYALAVTIYRSLTGLLPPAAEQRLTGENVKWPSQLGISLPSHQWEQALQKAMALRIEDRYQTVTAFWQELTGYEPSKPHISGHQGGSHSGSGHSPYSPHMQDNKGTTLVCTRGIYAGSRIPIREETLLGTDRNRCSIVYPPGSPGVSRVHLRLWADKGQMLVMDMGSTYGTWLNEKRMTPGLVYALNPGMNLYLGDGQTFRAESQ